VKRASERASYERAEAYAILDEALVAHVGLTTDAGATVIPMLQARDGDRMLLHGSAASRLLRSAGTTEICATVTLIDGLVLAKSMFHHSVNYRSVVAFGRPEQINDLDERRRMLELLTESLTPGRSTTSRQPTEKEVRATAVLALPLDEFSVKSRAGGPIDEPEDLDLPYWAGVIPLTLTRGEPVKH
jgi:uncharacterized protein